MFTRFFVNLHMFWFAFCQSKYCKLFSIQKCCCCQDDSLLLHFLRVDGSAASPPEVGGMTSTGNGSERKHTSLAQCQKNLSHSRRFLFEGAKKFSKKFFLNFLENLLNLRSSMFAVPFTIHERNEIIKLRWSWMCLCFNKGHFCQHFLLFFSSASSPLSRTESSEEWVMDFLRLRSSLGWLSKKKEKGSQQKNRKTENKNKQKKEKLQTNKRKRK